MGKPRKLRSSIKAIHEALASFRLSFGGPLCVQPAKTDSFRDLITSFNSVYCTPAVSSSSYDFCSHRSLFHHPVDIRLVSHGEGGEEEEETVSLSAAITATSTCSSCLSSSSVAAGPDHADEAEEFPTGPINSKRFFFSPCTSKSVTGEPFLKAEDEEGGVFDTLVETTAVLEEKTAMASEFSALCMESIPMAVASRDPYRDFRSSMGEMVAAHGLKDWSGLQELLHCYLRLNEKDTHKFIVLAFADLLTQLASQDNIDKSVVNDDTFSPWPMPSPIPSSSSSSSSSSLSSFS